MAFCVQAFRTDAISCVTPQLCMLSRIVRMLAKIADHFSIGVEYVWIIDPLEGKALCYSR